MKEFILCNDKVCEGGLAVDELEKLQKEHGRLKGRLKIERKTSEFMYGQRIDMGDKISDQHKQIKTFEEKLLKIKNYSKGHIDQMWSATVLSVILECDFREVKEVLKEKR